MKLWALALGLLVLAVLFNGCGGGGCPEGYDKETTGSMIVMAGKTPVFIPQYECREQ